MVQWLFVAALVGCGHEIDSGFRFVHVDEPIDAVQDAGADAGRCPEYRPDDSGVVVLMRGCPLTIEYSIH
jgi:hypothetical protein